jgi:proliferating cell nuclear antigen
MASESNSESNILNITTSHISLFRNLIAGLKDILPKTTIQFTSEGIRISDLNTDSTIAADICLYTDMFNEYNCTNEIIIGVDMFRLFKLINTLNNDDNLTICIEENDYDDQNNIASYLTLKVKNDNLAQFKIYKLKLLKLDFENLEVPPVEFPYVIELSSSNFQKIIRDLTNIYDKVKIVCTSNNLTFKCEEAHSSAEEHSSAELHCIESDGNITFIKKPNSSETIEGTFNLSKLARFIKFTNLSDRVELSLNYKSPLIVKYYVGNLGYINLCLAQVVPSSE